MATIFASYDSYTATAVPFKDSLYDSYGTTAVSAADINYKTYLLNQTYSLSGSNEANTMDRLASEWYYLYGTDMIFLPREVNKEETTFGEYLSAVFNKGIPMRMFIEETEMWSGNGDMYSKFGLQVTDECTLFCTKSFFTEQTSGVYPKQGDLMYVPKSSKLFQISHLEDEIQPAFYLLGNRSGLKIQCKMFAYNHEVINQSVTSGIPSAIQALDSLLMDLDNKPVTAVASKDFSNNNKQNIIQALPIIDNHEQDPLLG